MKWLVVVMLGLMPLVSVAAEIEACSDSECVDYFKQYRQFAKRGYASAMYGVAEMYYVGYGTKPDLKRAIKNYRKAAKYGSVIAKYKVGYIYLSDERVADQNEGLKYLKAAARLCHHASAYIVGMVYYNEAVSEDEMEEADKWLSRAFKDGNKRVKQFISQLHENGLLVPTVWPKLYAHAEEFINVEHVNNVNVPIKVKSLAVANKPRINWPEEKMETIRVSPPSLTDVFDYEIDSFSYIEPEKYRVNTGTRLIGRTCEKTIACSTLSRSQFSRAVQGLALQIELKN